MTITTSSTAAMVDFPQLPSVSPNKNTMPNQYALRYVLVKTVKNLMKLYFFVVILYFGAQLSEGYGSATHQNILQLQRFIQP